VESTREISGMAILRDYDLLDEFIGDTLERYKEGRIDQRKAIAQIAELVVIIDKGGPPLAGDPIDYMNACLEEDE
jgi:hypothetical protein